MLTSLKPSLRLKNREAHWLKRLAMVAEIAGELLDPARSVDISVHRGNGAQALVEASMSASIVVVQRRRTSPGTRISAGSTCAQVARAARSPAVVLSATEPSAPPWGNVVVGVDAASAGSALTLAFHEAELRQTGVVAVHSWRPRPVGLLLDGPTEEEEFRRQFGEKHRAFIEYVRPWAIHYPQVPLRHRLFTLPPTESILLESTRGQLLILGRHRRSLGSPGLGSVTRRCLTEASCPVLVSGSGQRVELSESAASGR
jgi:nucleotide-binding universal stress UspA family protein